MERLDHLALRTTVTVTVAMTYIYLLVRDHSIFKVYCQVSRSDRDLHKSRGNRLLSRDVNYERYESTDSYIKTPVSRSSLPRIDKFIRIFYFFSSFLHSVLLVKYTIICIISNRKLSSLGFIDCYLVGRLAFTARTSAHFKHISLFLSFFHLLWRIMMLYIRPVMKLDWVEFLLRDHDEVMLCEIDSTKNDSCNQESVDKSFKNKANAASGFQPRYESLFFIRNDFSKEGTCYILKPNRTVEGRRILVGFTRLYQILVGFFIGAVLAFVYSVIVTVIFTRTGFELSYITCVNWIRNYTKTNGHQDYEFIYIPDERKGIMSNADRYDYVYIPWNNFTEINFYHTLRIICDFAESFLFWVDTAVAFYFYTFVGCISCLDILIYYFSLRTKIMKTNNRIRKKQTMYVNELNQVYLSDIPRVREISPDINHCELSDIQATVVDFFRLVRNYNNYAAFYTFQVILLWVTYTILFCGWFCATERSVQVVEWYLIEVVATIFMIFIIGSFGLVDYINRRMYNYLATIMTLDTNLATTKRRWCLIMDFYSPDPLYCFTMFRSTKITVLLCLKVSPN